MKPDSGTNGVGCDPVVVGNGHVGDLPEMLDRPLVSSVAIKGIAEVDVGVGEVGS